MKDSMTFGQALEALKAGKKVARRGWNGRGMFLWLKPATTVKSDMCHDPILKGIVASAGGEVPALGTICMFTYDSTGRKAILTGWLASQSDMLLDDWEVVGEQREDGENGKAAEDAPSTTPGGDGAGRSETLGRAIGSMLAPLALLGAGAGGKLPEINVNIWSLGK